MRRNRWLIAGVGAALLAAAAGGALAATELRSQSPQDSAIISNAASRLGVTPSALSDALLKAIDDELNAEVSAGTITQAQASALESRLASGQLPLFDLFFARAGRGFGGGLGLGADLKVVESYLGLSASQIRSDLRSGKTLAQIAVAQGKTADGLIAALVSAAKANLAKAVAAGRLSSSQEAAIESKLQSAITAIVNGTMDGRGFGFGFGGRPFRGAFAGRFGVGLNAAAAYLGLNAAQIRSDLRSGKTLAQIAVAQGKTADGLIAALVSAAKAKLATAVAAGRLSSSQEAAIESKLPTVINAIVNGTMRGPRLGFGFRGRGFGRGMPGAPPIFS